jgi:hypothetical protein
MGAFRACPGVAVDGAEVVPELVDSWFEIILNLDDAGWSDSVVGKVTHLDCEAAAELCSVDHAVDDGPRITGDHDAFVVFTIPEQFVLVIDEYC